MRLDPTIFSIVCANLNLMSLVVFGLLAKQFPTSFYIILFHWFSAGPFSYLNAISTFSLYLDEYI